MKKLSYLFIIALLVVGIVFINHGGSFNSNNIHDDINVKESNNNTKNKEYKLSLLMVGDMLIHDYIYEEAEENAKGNGYDFKPMVTEIKNIAKDYDLAYYNQETILGGSDIGVSSYPAFNSPYEVGDAMIDAGFNMVSLATNHTLDRGGKAVENSCKYWKEHSDVLAVGSYCSEEDRDAVVIKEKNNIKYALLNYTYGTNGISVPNGKEYYVNIWPTSSKSAYENYKEVVKSDIEKLRDKVDVLMVAMHFGEEYNFDKTTYQEDAAEYLASLGVDIVIGTHSHVVGPIEHIGDTLVIYSLGNFLSAHSVKDISNRIGLMSSVKITKVIEDDKVDIKINNDYNELLYTYYDDYTDFRVIPFSKLNDDLLKNYQSIHDKYAGYVTKYDETVVVK